MTNKKSKLDTNDTTNTSESSIKPQAIRMEEKPTLVEFENKESTVGLGSKSITEVSDHQILDAEKSSRKKSKNVLIWFTNTNFNIAWKQFYVGLQAFAALIGVSGTLMGLINSFPSLFNLFQSFFGRLSDRFGRKIILIFGFFVLTLSTSILIFFASPLIIVFVAMAQALSTAIIVPVWNATLGDVAPRKTRATFLGKIAAVTAIVDLVISTLLTILFYLADSNSSIFGFPIAIPALLQTKITFIIASLNCLAAVLFVIFIRETRVVKEEDIVSTSRFVEVFKDRPFVKYIIFSCIFAFFGNLPWGVFSLVMVNVLEMTFWQMSLYFTAIGLVRSVIQFLGGKLSDKLARRKPLLIVGAMLAPSMALFVVLSSVLGRWWLLLVDLLISSVGLGLLNVLILASILDVAPKDLRGTYTGTFYSCWGIISFIASIVGGVIADVLVINYGYYVMAIALFAGAFIGQLMAAFGYFFIDESLL